MELEFNQIEYFYNNIKERINRKGKLKQIAQYLGGASLLPLLITYIVIIRVRPSLGYLLLVIFMFLIFLLLVVSNLIFTRKSDKIKITDHEKIFYQFQEIKRDLINLDFTNARKVVQECVLFFKDIINKYKYVDFIGDAPKNLTTIEENLREYIYPFLDTEDNDIDREKVKIICGYFDRASYQIYNKMLMEAAKFPTQSFTRVEIPINQLMPQPIHRRLLNEITEYVKNQRPVVRFIINFSIISLIALLLDMWIRNQDFELMKNDVFLILTLGAVIASTIENSMRKV